MRLRKLLTTIAVAAFAISLSSGICFAEKLKIAIMQASAGEAREYAPLLEYLNDKGIEASFVTAQNYPAAAKMFADGSVDAMFSGSGIAGSMIIKDLAEPVARPVGKDGYSTYWAVVVAPKGSPKFNDSAAYFNGKKVIYSSLASAGEFFFRSLGPSQAASLLEAASHGAAIDALNRGSADIAVVKNRVWDKESSKYPAIEKVGEDKGENPDRTLIVSKKVSASTASKIQGILLGLKDDSSPKAKAVKDSLKIQSYIKTGREDFSHTIQLLKEAGVTKDFDFRF